MHVEESFTVGRPPEAVFDYMADPANVREWQTAKTRVEPLTRYHELLRRNVERRSPEPGA